MYLLNLRCLSKKLEFMLRVRALCRSEPLIREKRKTAQDQQYKDTGKATQHRHVVIAECVSSGV